VSGIIAQVSKATHLSEDDRLHIVCYWCEGWGVGIKVKNVKCDVPCFTLALYILGLAVNERRHSQW